VEIWERRHLVTTLVVVGLIGAFVLLMGIGVIDAQGAPLGCCDRQGMPKLTCDDPVPCHSGPHWSVNEHGWDEANRLYTKKHPDDPPCFLRAPEPGAVA